MFEQPIPPQARTSLIIQSYSRTGDYHGCTTRQAKYSARRIDIFQVRTQHDHIEVAAVRDVDSDVTPNHNSSFMETKKLRYPGCHLMFTIARAELRTVASGVVVALEP